MGGEYRNSNPPSQNAVQSPYSYIKAFNTETNTWSFVNLTGDVPAAGRFYSTLTLCKLHFFFFFKKKKAITSLLTNMCNT